MSSYYSSAYLPPHTFLLACLSQIVFIKSAEFRKQLEFQKPPKPVQEEEEAEAHHQLQQQPRPVQREGEGEGEGEGQGKQQQQQQQQQRQQLVPNEEESSRAEHRYTPPSLEGKEVSAAKERVDADEDDFSHFWETYCSPYSESEYRALLESVGWGA